MTPAAQTHDERAQAHQRWMRNLAIGSALALGAVIVAPYVLPLVGVGDAALAEDMALAVHGTDLGNGWAGKINEMLNAIPLIGGELAKGGMMTAASTGIIGIGGVLLGRYVERRDDGSSRVRWGKIIVTASLITSSLIALPSLLTGISSGIAFLAAVADPALGSAVAGWLSKTIGAIGTASMAAAGLSGAAFTLPHLLTCGTSVVPAAIAFAVSGKKPLPRGSAADAEIVARIVPDTPTEANVPCEATITLRDAKTGAPITPDMLKESYTKKLHLLVIDQSLRDYQHLHPEPTSQPGVYRCRFTPSTSNAYSAWADFTLNKDGKNHRIKMPLSCKSRRAAKAVIRTGDHAEINGLRFEWQSQEPLRKNTPSIVEIDVSDAQGNPVTDLEPVMGTLAHLVGFSADGNSLVHCHPQDGPKLRFHVEPQTDGPMQFYLQVKRGGQEIFVPFGQEIAKNRAFGQRIADSRALAASPGHAH